MAPGVELDHDQPGMTAGQVVGAQTEAFQGSGPVAVDDDVGARSSRSCRAGRPAGRVRDPGRRCVCRGGCRQTAPGGHIGQPGRVDAQHLGARGRRGTGCTPGRRSPGSGRAPGCLRPGDRPGPGRRARGGAGDGPVADQGSAATARPWGGLCHSPRRRTAAATPPAAKTASSSSSAPGGRRRPATARPAASSAFAGLRGPRRGPPAGRRDATDSWRGCGPIRPRSARNGRAERTRSRLAAATAEVALAPHRVRPRAPGPGSAGPWASPAAHRRAARREQGVADRTPPPRPRPAGGTGAGRGAR